MSPEVSINANGGVIVLSDQQVHAQSSALSELYSSAETLYWVQHVGHLVPTIVTTPGCNIGSSVVMFAFRMMHVHFIHKIIEVYYANKMSMHHIIPKVKGHMEHNHSMLCYELIPDSLTPSDCI